MEVVDSSVRPELIINTRHTCKPSDTQLYNPELELTCSSECTVVSTAQEGVGRVTGGGGGSPATYTRRPNHRVTRVLALCAF